MPEAELSLLFLRPLNQLGLRYIVSGSVASILYGEPRFTNDVDVVVFLRPEDIPRLREVFASPEFYLPPAEVIAAEIARPEKGQFNVIHAALATKQTSTPQAGMSLTRGLFATPAGLISKAK